MLSGDINFLDIKKLSEYKKLNFLKVWKIFQGEKSQNIKRILYSPPSLFSRVLKYLEDAIYRNAALEKSQPSELSKRK